MFRFQRRRSKSVKARGRPLGPPRIVSVFSRKASPSAATPGGKQAEARGRERGGRGLGHGGGAGAAEGVD